MKQFITERALEDLKEYGKDFGTDSRGNVKVKICVKRKYVEIEINNKDYKIKKDYFLSEIERYTGENYISSMYSILNSANC